MLYPVNGLRVIVDPYKGTVSYQMVTDQGTRRVSAQEAQRLMDAARDARPPADQSKVA